MADFSLILTQPAQREPLALAKILAAVRKTPVQDQLSAAKGGWGVLAAQLEEPAARALGEQLKAAGLACAVIRSDALAALPAPEPLNRLEPGWTAGLTLIAAAAVTVTTTTTRIVKQGPSSAQKVLSAGILLTTGLPIPIGPKMQEVKKEQTQSDLAFYADFLYQNPPRRRRVDAQHFDYSFLKERKLYQLVGNFKLLLNEAAQGAPQAGRNHGAKLILEGQPLNRMGYETLEDLESETRWLLTLQGLKP